MNVMPKRPGRMAAAVVILAFILAACQSATPAPPTPTPTLAVPPTATAVPLPPTPEPLVIEGATNTDTGLQYLEINPGSGETPKAGEIITMNYMVTLPDGTQLANTFTDNKPVQAVWGSDRLLPGWEEGIGLMKVGGRSKFVIPPELAFGAQGSGAVPPNSQIVIEMELLSSEAPPQPTAVKETDLTKTESGLQYYDLKTGEGNEAVKNGRVSTNYVVWTRTAEGYQYIDQSGEQGPVSFVVGTGGTVFPGWEEGVTGMKMGGKRLLVIPPALGMGEQGNGLVPPNSTLVMEIELVEATEPQVATQVDEKDFTTTPSGLKFYDLVKGTGESPAPGQTVVVHYTGWLEDGTQFDSSLDSGQPFSFQLGAGNVIPGWEEGVAGMKVGGKRQLVIPSALGYGDTGAGATIPPGATLIFEIELLALQ